VDLFFCLDQTQLLNESLGYKNDKQVNRP